LHTRVETLSEMLYQWYKQFTYLRWLC